MQCAVDDRRVRDKDFNVDRWVESDDPNHDGGLGQAEGQDCATGNL